MPVTISTLLVITNFKLIRFILRNLLGKTPVKSQILEKKENIVEINM